MSTAKNHSFEIEQRLDGGNTVVALAADNLRRQRELLKLTQADAAKICGVSYGAYRGLENGNPNAGLRLWASVFIALGAPLDRVFVTDEDPEYHSITTIVHKRKARRYFSNLVKNSLKSRADNGEIREN